jgi:hypothetical protein
MGEEEQATPWRFFKVADSIAVRDENFLEVKNRWILHQLLRFLLVRGGAPRDSLIILSLPSPYFPPLFHLLTLVSFGCGSCNG